MMHDYGIDNPITRRPLMINISQNMPSIVISHYRGSIPCVMHSKKDGREAVDIAKAEQDVKGDLNAILNTQSQVRSANYVTWQPHPSAHVSSKIMHC